MKDKRIAEHTPVLGKDGQWPRERLLALVLFLATATAFVVSYLLVRPFLPTLAWALALAIIAHPLHDWIGRRVHHENRAAALSVLIIAVVIVAPTIFISQRVVREAAAGMQTIKAEAESGKWRTAFENNPRLDPVLRWVERNVDLSGTAEYITAAITTRGSALLKNSVWIIAELLITFFFLFYFLRDRFAAVGTLRSLIPLSDTETDEVFRRVTETIYATVYGTLAVAVVQGLLGGLIFWWLGLPAPLLWGAVMGLLAIVPVLGAFIIWIPAAAFLALGGNWVKALTLAAFGGIVISLVDNWLYPVLVGQRLRLHTVPVFIAIVGGVALFGAAGLILGPVILAVTVALVDIWRRRTAATVIGKPSANATPDEISELPRTDRRA